MPEQGDWYARSMYLQGTRQYDYHVKTYGPPSEFGFMEIDHLWTAEHWDPERLMELYVAAGAKYFVALANHEDNFGLLRLEVLRVEFRQRRAAPRHRRDLGAGRAGARPALWRLEPLLPRLALVPAGLWL